MIALSGSASGKIGDCCFRGATGSDAHAAYISHSGYTSTTTVTFELPLCFDLSEQHSLNFNGATPWEEVSSHFQIFNCESCDQQATVEFTASDSFTASESFTASQSFTSAPSTSAPSGSPDASATETTGSDGSDSRKGLSAGAAAGIAIVVIVLIAAIVILLILIVRRKRQHTAEGSGDDPQSEMTEETATTNPASFLDTEWNGRVTEENPIFSTQPDDIGQAAFEEEWL